MGSAPSKPGYDKTSGSTGHDATSGETSGDADTDPQMCATHDKPCALFCLQCAHALCAKCPMSRHQQHPLVALVETVAESVAMVTQGVEREQDKLKAFLEKLDATKARVGEEGRTAREAVDDRVKEIVEELKREADKVKKEIVSQAAHEIKRLEDVQKSVVAKLETGRGIVEDAMRLPVDTSVAENADALRDVIRKTRSHHSASSHVRRSDVTCRVLRLETSGWYGGARSALGRTKLLTLTSGDGTDTTRYASTTSRYGAGDDDDDDDLSDFESCTQS